MSKIVPFKKSIVGSFAAAAVTLRLSDKHIASIIDVVNLPRSLTSAFIIFRLGLFILSPKW